MANILIAGCGDLGCRLGSQLSESGHNIFGIRRNANQLPNCIQPIVCDLAVTNPNLPNKLDYVFYILAADSFKDSAYYQAYVLGVKHLLLSLQGKNIKRLFFISSSSVFGQDKGQVVTETCPTSDHSFSSHRLLEGESLINNSPFPSTIIRFAGIYGPGRSHLIDLVLEGKAHCMEGVYSNRIHTDDCVNVMQHLMLLNNPAELYIAVDNEPTLTCEVYEWLAEQLSIAKIDHISPSETSRIMRSNKKLSNQRLLDSGYQFKYPSFREGYLSLLAEMDY